MRSLAAVAVAGVLGVAAGCTQQGSSLEGKSGTVNGEVPSGAELCEAGYVDEVTAANRRALNQKMLSHFDGDRLRVQGSGPSGDGTVANAEYVDVLNARGGRIWQVDVFERPDGEWFAGLYGACQ